MNGIVKMLSTDSSRNVPVEFILVTDVVQLPPLQVYDLKAWLH